MALPAWAIGALVGLGKNELIDRPKEEADRERELITMKYSPWTGRQSNLAGVKRANSFGEILKGAAVAAMGKQKGWFGDNESSPAQMNTNFTPINGDGFNLMDDKTINDSIYNNQNVTGYDSPWIIDKNKLPFSGGSY